MFFSRRWKRVASVERGLFWIALDPMFKTWRIISRIEVSGKLNFFASFLIDFRCFLLSLPIPLLRSQEF